MKLFVWRNGWLGAISFAMADTQEQAMELIRSSDMGVGDDSYELEFSNPPEVFDSPKAMVIWADIWDGYESG